jgi:hypothetical protein
MGHRIRVDAGRCARRHVAVPHQDFSGKASGAAPELSWWRVGYPLVTSNAGRGIDRQLHRPLSVEEVTAMFDGLDVEEVRQIIRYYVDRVSAQIIAAALASPARTLRLTDETTDEELSAFIGGRPYP